MMIPLIADVIALAVILACSLDVVRVVHLRDQPVRSVVFALLAVGAFGQLFANFHGYAVHWWALSLHIGVAIPVGTPFVLRFVSWRRSHGDHRQSAGRPV